MDFDITVCRRVPREIWVRSYKKCNWDQVRESLASAPWNVMSIIYDDLDDQWSFFHSIVMEFLHLNAPLKRVYSKKSKRPTPCNWISDAILEKIRLKNKVKRRAEKSADKEAFRKCKNELKGIIRQAKIDYLQHSVMQCRRFPKKAGYMWSCINAVIGRSKSHKSVIGDSVSLDSINDFFRTVAISSKHQSADSYVLPACDTGDFSFDRVTVSTVLSHLSTLDVSKSTRPDGLSAAFLREVANEIAVPLTNLYNQSLLDGFIPVGWKQSHITPVYKGGECNDPSNYRPISVVPILAKVLEKIVSVQFIQYLEKNNLLHPHQGAFRCGKSTEDILLLTVDHIVNTLDAGKSVCAAFLDLKKAFDSLDHCILLQRIGDLGVAGPVLRII